MRVAPYLLRMTWNGYPLIHHKTKKWGYLKLRQDNSVVNTDNDNNTEIDPAHYLENLSSLVKEEHENYEEQWNGYDEMQEDPPDDELILEFINQKALFYRLPHKVMYHCRTLRHANRHDCCRMVPLTMWVTRYPVTSSLRWMTARFARSLGEMVEGS